MKLEEIFEEWEKDGALDLSELAQESADIAKLHHKYYKYFVREKFVLSAYEAELKQLRFAKAVFFEEGPDQETAAKGWQFPLGKTKILKSDIDRYVDVEKDVIELTLKVGTQKDKVQLLDSIIRMITNRNFQIKSAIDFLKFTQGA